VRLVASLPGKLNDQPVSSHSQSFALALLHDPLGFISRSEGHKASSLGLSLVIHQNVDLPHFQFECLKGRCEGVLVDSCAQVADVDSLDLTSRLAWEVGG